MDFATSMNKRDDGSVYFEDYATRNFHEAKEKFLDLLDLHKIGQLKIIADLEENVEIDISYNE